MDDILKAAWEDFHPNSKLMEDPAKAKKLLRYTAPGANALAAI